MRRIGFERGRSFDLAILDPSLRHAPEQASGDGLRLMEWALPKLGRVVDRWSVDLDPIGGHGNDDRKRAIIARNGPGATLPADAIHPLNMGDRDGRPLDGARKGHDS